MEKWATNRCAKAPLCGFCRLNIEAPHFPVSCFLLPRWSRHVVVVVIFDFVPTKKEAEQNPILMSHPNSDGGPAQPTPSSSTMESFAVSCRWCERQFRPRPLKESASPGTATDSAPLASPALQAACLLLRQELWPQCADRRFISAFLSLVFRPHVFLSIGVLVRSPLFKTIVPDGPSLNGRDAAPFP